MHRFWSCSQNLNVRAKADILSALPNGEDRSTTHKNSVQVRSSHRSSRDDGLVDTRGSSTWNTCHYYTCRSHQESEQAWQQTLLPLDRLKDAGSTRSLDT